MDSDYIAQCAEPEPPCILMFIIFPSVLPKLSSFFLHYLVFSKWLVIVTTTHPFASRLGALSSPTRRSNDMLRLLLISTRKKIIIDGYLKVYQPDDIPLLKKTKRNIVRDYVYSFLKHLSY